MSRILSLCNSKHTPTAGVYQGQMCDWLEERRKQADSAIFNAQYQNGMKLTNGHIFREGWFEFYEVEPNCSRMTFFIGCDPAATSREALVQGKRAETDWRTIVEGATAGPTVRAYKYSPFPRF